MSDFIQSTFFYLRKFVKKLADDLCSSITKDSIYHIKHMYIVEWPEIWCLKEVSTLFYICRYCVFTWWGRSTGMANVWFENIQSINDLIWYHFKNLVNNRINSHLLITDVLHGSTNWMQICQEFVVNLYQLMQAIW